VLFFAERLWQGGNPFMLFSFRRHDFILRARPGLWRRPIFYYTALSHGAVTLVVPIWGLQVVGASIVAIVVLQEGLSWQKLLSIAFAVLVIYFAMRQ
jgi:drug/metabolite transporter (DMT)-like permease